MENNNSTPKEEGFIPRFLLKKGLDFVVAEEKYKYFYETNIDCATVSLIETDERIETGSLEFKETKVFMDEYPCGNPIERMAKEYATKNKYDFVVVGEKTMAEEVDATRIGLLPATFFSKR